MKAVIKSGRLANGAERDKGKVVHYGDTGYGKALCGAKPADRSAMGFVEAEGPVNCPKCLNKNSKINQQVVKILNQAMESES